MHREAHIRSVAKALSWRLIGTFTTMAAVFLFTKKLEMSVAVGALEFGAKVVLFWLHERFWNRIQHGKIAPRPAVIWFTGLSGSGKTTIAQRVFKELENRGVPVEHLDGDSIRDIFPNTGFSREERDQHIKRVGFLAGKLERNGVFVVVSLVSPYEDSRRFVRGLCQDFHEVYVATPLEECERRDVKGLYARARRGEIKNFTGISDPYEPPACPEIQIDTRSVSAEDAGARVLARLRDHF